MVMIKKKRVFVKKFNFNKEFAPSHPERYSLEQEQVILHQLQPSLSMSEAREQQLPRYEGYNPLYKNKGPMIKYFYTYN